MNDLEYRLPGVQVPLFSLRHSVNVLRYMQEFDRLNHLVPVEYENQTRLSQAVSALRVPEGY